MDKSQARKRTRKVDIPDEPPEGSQFPSYLAWYYSSILLPYPLTIITTVDANGVPNAQPNTWGMPYGSSSIQMYLFSASPASHTGQNVLKTRQFVVNVPSRDVVNQVLRTVEHYPRGVDEVATSGLTALPSRRVDPPRIMECKAHLECEYLWHQIVGDKPGPQDIVIAGRVVAASADRDVLQGSLEQKLAAMKTPYCVGMSVDGTDWRTCDPLSQGVISDLETVTYWDKA